MSDEQLILMSQLDDCLVAKTFVHLGWRKTGFPVMWTY